MSYYDPNDETTRPVPLGTGWVDPLAETRPQQAAPPPADPSPAPAPKKGRRRWTACNCGCGCLPGLLGAIVLLGVYFLAPARTNILILGVDAREEEGVVGRTDTNILATVLPLQPYVGMLSIPRDLWVTVPGHGEHRINTAHFFAEAEQPGSGPIAAIDTVSLNFGVQVDYFVRIRFQGLKDVVDALGGIEIDFPQPAIGLTAGTHRLDGEQALAYVRDRAGADDFSRMAHGQQFLKGGLTELLKPATWPRLPTLIRSLPGFADTDIPIWLWPRLGLALLRVGPDGFDARVITREMVNPFTTAGGAAVLAPNWEAINPVLFELFGQ